MTLLTKLPHFILNDGRRRLMTAGATDAAERDYSSRRDEAAGAVPRSYGWSAALYVEHLEKTICTSATVISTKPRSGDECFNPADL